MDNIFYNKLVVLNEGNFYECFDYFLYIIYWLSIYTYMYIGGKKVYKVGSKLVSYLTNNSSKQKTDLF